MIEVTIYNAFYSSVEGSVNAYDFCISKTVNEDYRLTFSVALTEKNTKFLQVSNTIIYKGQKFRIVSITKNSNEDGSSVANITAFYYYYTDTKIIKSTFGDYYGDSVASILSKIFSDTEYSMECLIFDKTDFSIVDVKTIKELVDELINNIGYGEVDFDGNDWILKEEIGTQKSIKISLDSNAQSIQREDDITNIITKLYPFGADNIDISSQQSNGAIASDNIAVYGRFEGTKTYSSIDKPEALIKRAWWEFDERNPERIDVPMTTISCKYVDLSKIDNSEVELSVGDSVMVYDKATDFDGELFRVKQTIIYPDEPEKNSIILGKQKSDIISYLRKFNKKIADINSVTAGSNKAINKQIETIVKKKGSGGGIVIDHLPSVSEIEEFQEGAIICVYNLDEPYIPSE